MDKNRKLILILIVTFLITNGTFFALCEEDIILKYINRFGDWTNAALWHSTKAFLYYAAADTFYNIRYIAPKVAYTLAPIKWADKVNGWLGGSSIGELEKHLAQDKYCPLYKDFIIGLNTNLGLPIYNNVWHPILSLFNPKVQNLDKAVNVSIVERVKYKPVLDSETGNLISHKLSRIEASSRDFYQKILGSYNLGATLFDDVLKLKGQPLYSIDYLSEFLAFDYYKQKLMVHNDNISIASNGDEHTTQYLHQINPIYPQAFQIQTIQLQNYDCDDTDFSNRIDNWYLNVVGFASVPQTNFAAGYRPMAVYECSYEIPVVDIYYITRDSGNFVLFLKERSDLPINIIFKDNQFFVDGYRGDVTLSFDQAFSTLKEQLSVVQHETQAMSVSLTSVIAATVGLIGLTTQHLDSINATNLLSDAIINSGIGQDVAFVFLKHGHPLPEILQQFAQNIDLIPNSPRLSGDLSPSAFSSLSSQDTGVPTPYLKYFSTIVLAVGAIGGGIYLWKNGYLDYNTAVSTVKSFEETLREKYINFK